MGTQGPLSKSAAPFLFVALVLRALVGPAKELRARQLLHVPLLLKISDLVVGHLAEESVTQAVTESCDN